MNPLSSLWNLFTKSEKKTELSAVDRKLVEGIEAFEMGNNLFMKKRYREALLCFDKAIECGFENGNLYAMRGACLQALDSHPEAIEDFNKAIALEPYDSNHYFQRSLSKGATGDVHGQVSDLQEAMQVASVDNAANRSHNAFAKEQGYEEGVIGFYRIRLMMANTRLETPEQERIRREFEEIKRQRQNQSGP